MCGGSALGDLFEFGGGDVGREDDGMGYGNHEWRWQWDDEIWDVIITFHDGRELRRIQELG